MNGCAPVKPTMTKRAHIRGVRYHLPAAILDNSQLAAEIPGWTAAQIHEKTGIAERRVAAPGETATDLGALAALKLFADLAIQPMDLDYLLFCNQRRHHRTKKSEPVALKRTKLFLSVQSIARKSDNL